MYEETSLKDIKKEWHGSFKGYIIGLISSLLLTAASFTLAFTRLFSETTLILTIVSLAMTQAIIQLIYFLHLGKESKPKWEFLIFLFMVMVLLIIVLGTLWIMFDLNGRVMGDMTNMHGAHHHD